MNGEPHATDPYRHQLETAAPEQCGMDAAQLAASLDRLTARHTGLHGVLVARQGRLVLDASFQGQSSRERHILNSCTKSVLSALAGIAVARGHFRLTDSVVELLPSHRLAYVVDEVCVLRYDNEIGKGDHRHYDEVESVYKFTTPEQLIADFQTDIARWNSENSDS